MWLPVRGRTQLRLFVSPRNTSPALHRTFVPVRPPNFHASTTPRLSFEEGTSPTRPVHFLVRFRLGRGINLHQRGRHTSFISAQPECRLVLCNPPRHRFSPLARHHHPTHSMYARRPSWPGDLSHPRNILTPYNYPCTPTWMSADDEKLHTAEYDADSPANLLKKLEQGTVTHLPVGKKALPRRGPVVVRWRELLQTLEEEGNDEEVLEPLQARENRCSEPIRC